MVLGAELGSYLQESFFLKFQRGGFGVAATVSKPEQPQEQPNTPVVDVHGAAAIVGLSYKTLNSMRTRGGGPRYAKLGRRVVYRVADLQAWIAERVRSSTAG